MGKVNSASVVSKKSLIIEKNRFLGHNFENSDLKVRFPSLHLPMEVSQECHELKNTQDFGFPSWSLGDVFKKLIFKVPIGDDNQILEISKFVLLE